MTNTKNPTFPVYKFSTELTRVYSTCNRGGVTVAFVDGFIQTEPDFGNKLSRANAPAHCSAASKENWPKGLQTPPICIPTYSRIALRAFCLFRISFAEKFIILRPHLRQCTSFKILKEPFLPL